MSPPNCSVGPCCRYRLGAHADAGVTAVVVLPFGTRPTFVEKKLRAPAPYGVAALTTSRAYPNHRIEGSS